MSSCKARGFDESARGELSMELLFELDLRSKPSTKKLGKGAWSLD